MTPQERDLVLGLTQRLKQTAPQQPKDAEAEALVKRELAGMPDAAYYLIQTVLIQEMALQQAQNRINELERAPAQAPQQQRSFLGGSVPPSGPWGRQQAQQRPGMPGVGGWGGQPQGMQPMMPPSATSGFLRNAAMTAAGIAGGALLFHGITSMLGGGSHGATPGASEASSQGGAWTPAEQPQEQLASNEPGYEDPGAQDVAYDDTGAGFDDSDLA
jgi:hypothetical protein